MPKITLVCSAHRAKGACNAEELLKILQTIEPEVVFEEMRPADFDSYCVHGVGTSVEAQALAKYSEFKSFRRIPVDRYDIPAHLIAEFKRQCDCVFGYVAQKSREYQLLNEENDNRVRQDGYKYLNSVAFATAMKRMSEIEDDTVKEAGDQDLIRALEGWRHHTLGREMEMVRNIYACCRENVVDTGMFLVGAAHKSAIVKRIEKYGAAEADLIEWKHYQ